MKNYCISKRPTSLTCVLYFAKRVKYWTQNTEIRSMRQSVTEKAPFLLPESLPDEARDSPPSALSPLSPACYNKSV